MGFGGRAGLTHDLSTAFGATGEAESCLANIICAALGSECAAAWRRHYFTDSRDPTRRRSRRRSRLVHTNSRLHPADVVEAHRRVDWKCAGTTVNAPTQLYGGRRRPLRGFCDDSRSGYGSEPILLARGRDEIIIAASQWNPGSTRSNWSDSPLPGDGNPVRLDIVITVDRAAAVTPSSTIFFTEVSQVIF